MSSVQQETKDKRKGNEQQEEEGKKKTVKDEPTKLEEGEIEDEDIPEEILKQIEKEKEKKEKEGSYHRSREDRDRERRHSSSSRHRSHHHRHSSSSRHGHHYHHSHSRHHHHHYSDSDSDSDYDRRHKRHSSHRKHDNSDDDKHSSKLKDQTDQGINTDNQNSKVDNNQNNKEVYKVDNNNNNNNNVMMTNARKPPMGVYIPPSRLRAMQKEITDKNGEEYQKLSWEALKKSINALINKVSVSNIKNIVPEFFRENLERGRGLFCRAIITAQHASPNFTAVYAALVAIVNTRVQEIGELLLHRLIDKFKKAYRRNNREALLTTVTFLAHLLNQQVCTPTLALEICITLLENSTEDGVEVTTKFIKECGYCLKQDSPKGFTLITDNLRTILHEGSTNMRIQYDIESLFKIINEDFAGYQGVPQELDIVEEGDQVIHDVDLETELNVQDNINYFKFDPKFEENEQRWKEMRQAILGESSDEDDDDDDDKANRHVEYNSEEEEDAVVGDTSSSSDDSDDDTVKEAKLVDGKELISDQTSTDLINLRKSIYLTFMSGLSYEEAVHKILCINIPPEKRIEICKMTLECCAQARTYDKYYSLVAERFCHLERDVYPPMYERMFQEQYADAHHLDTNKLRSTAKFFAHLLHSDAISWTVLECIHLNQEETNSASRIFIKNIFLDVAENLGLTELKSRLNEPGLEPYLAGLFPKYDPKKTRFAINFFTAIGLGGITDGLREQLKSAIMARTTIQNNPDDDDDDDESELSSSSSSSSSDSDSSLSSESSLSSLSSSSSSSVSSVSSDSSDPESKSKSPKLKKQRKE